VGEVGVSSAFPRQLDPARPAKPDHGILAVLVDESSTPPHLLVQPGAVYVRNPGCPRWLSAGQHRCERGLKGPANGTHKSWRERVAVPPDSDTALQIPSEAQIELVERHRPSVAV
jgi:hypothetical protein